MSPKTFAIEKREVRGAVVVYAALQGKTSLNVIDADIAASATLEFRDIVERYEPRCVILTGRDDKAFIGGADLCTLQTLNQDTAEAFIRSIHDFCTALYQAPVPVIAALQGYCLGAGLEIAASVASAALPIPEALPVPIIAIPISDITVLTSAKSTLIKPGCVINSEIP